MTSGPGVGDGDGGSVEVAAGEIVAVAMGIGVAEGVSAWQAARKINSRGNAVRREKNFILCSQNSICLGMRPFV